MMLRIGSKGVGGRVMDPAIDSRTSNGKSATRAGGAGGACLVGMWAGLFRSTIPANHLLFNASTAETRFIGLGIIRFLSKSICSGLAPWSSKAPIGNGSPRQYWYSRSELIHILLAVFCLSWSTPESSIWAFSRNGISDVNSSWTNAPRDQRSTFFVYDRLVTMRLRGNIP